MRASHLIPLMVLFEGRFARSVDAPLTQISIPKTTQVRSCVSSSLKAHTAFQYNGLHDKPLAMVLVRSQGA